MQNLINWNFLPHFENTKKQKFFFFNLKILSRKNPLDAQLPHFKKREIIDFKFAREENLLHGL